MNIQFNESNQTKITNVTETKPGRYRIEFHCDNCGKLAYMGKAEFDKIQTHFCKSPCTYSSVAKERRKKRKENLVSIILRPVQKPSIDIEKERIKKIMSVPVKPKATHYYWMQHKRGRYES